MASSGERTDAAVWSALGVVYVVWGSTYLGMAVLVEQVPPLLGMGTRFVCSAVVMALIIAAVRGVRALRVTRRELLFAGLIGVLLLTGGNGVVAAAERFVPSGIAALVIAVTPVWVVVFRRMSGDRPAALTVLGVVIGFAGVAALVLASSRSTDSPGYGYQDVSETAVLMWTLAVVAASLSWALGSFLAARFARQEGLPPAPLVLTFWQFATGGVGLLMAGLLDGESLPPPATWDGRAVTAWLYLVVAGILAFLCYTWLLANARLSLVATYAYVNPVVAVALGWWIKDENLTWALVGCGALIVVGVAMVVRGEQPAETESEPHTVKDGTGGG